jgi:hypothetical protein
MAICLAYSVVAHRAESDSRVAQLSRLLSDAMRELEWFSVSCWFERRFSDHRQRDGAYRRRRCSRETARTARVCPPVPFTAVGADAQSVHREPQVAFQSKRQTHFKEHMNSANKIGKSPTSDEMQTVVYAVRWGQNGPESAQSRFCLGLRVPTLISMPPLKALRG